MIHEQFDNLSGTDPDNRDRNDKIRNKVFDDLNQRIRKADTAEKTATEIFAHNQESNKSKNSKKKKFKFTLQNIQRVQKSLCELAHIIDSSLLWESSGGLVAMPQYDLLKDFDKQWSSEGNLQKLQEYWRQHVSDVEDWTQLEWPNF